MRRHNPESPLLVGEIHDNEIIHSAKQESLIDEQLTLF